MPTLLGLLTLTATVATWRVPFEAKDRARLDGLSVISTFGAPRESYVRGHLHTAVDLVPRPARSGARVFPVAPGRVVSIHLGDPHRTVVLEHDAARGEPRYTSYKHLARIAVVEGQAVDVDTALGRLYTRAEARAQGGNYDHLHFEARTRFDDEGAASWTTMTRAELDARFLDPLPLLRAKLVDGRAPRRR